jgi:tetratricopeptide (TPR) repeat protein
MWFKRRKPYSRSAIIEAAGKAQAKGQTKKAIAEYLKVLKADPDDHVVHGKVAPLLAKTKQFSESWSSFKAAGEGYNLGGFGEKALSIYVQATRCVPLEVEAWETVTRLQLNRGLRADSVNTLLKGHRYFRRRDLRQKAVHLLRKAWEITPWHFEVTFELARLLAKTGEKEEALRLLHGLLEREQSRNLRRIRGAILKISPTPASAWQWLRAALSGT